LPSRFSLWVLISVWLVACGGTLPPPTPTMPPRPTLAPRSAPTAQPTAVDAGVLEVGIPLMIALPGQTPVDVRFTLATAQAVTVTVSALSDDGAGNALDVVIELMDGQRQRIAYDDDSGGGGNAALTNLVLDAGEYSVRVNAFNGYQAGQVEVILLTESSQESES